MPRASRTSQAAAASAVAPDESLRAFYNTYDASSQPSASTSTSTSAANNPVDDSLWTRRRRGSGRVASSSAGRGDNANLNASTISNLTDVSVSVSSASLNSPGGETMQSSSHAESEASSYATRAIPGVIDEEDEERQERGGEEEEEEEEDSDEVIVVTSRRSRAATARRGSGRARTRASRNQHLHEDDPEEHDEEDDQHMGNTSAVNDASTVSITNSQFSSHLLDESDEDLPGGDITGHQSRSYGAGEVDELLNATNEEVEAKAMLELGWNEIGNDRELFKVDLERWKKIDKDSEKFKTVGSAEYQSLQAIQAKLLTVVQDLENTSWMFPEPLPFLSSIPQPSSTIGHKMPTTLPFHNHDFTSGNTWADKAFNPLSTFVPRAPEGQASWPDSYRVHRALGGLSSSENDIETERRGNEERARYHLNAIPRREPDFTWLEAEAESILGDQDKSFAAKAKFPWATALSSSSNGGKVQGVNGQHDVKIREGSMARGGSTSLTREVGIIRLS